MMSKFFLPFLAVLFLVSSCNTEPSFTVKVKVFGDKVDGQKVRVAMLDGMIPRDVDSTVVKGNSFKLKGRLKNPDFYLIYVGDHGPMELFLENSDIKVEYYLDSISKSKVIGSVSHDLFTSFFKGLEPYTKQLQVDRAALSGQEKTGSVAKKDSLYAVLEKQNKNIQQYMLSFFKKNNNSVVSPFLLSHTILGNLSTQEAEAIVANFGPDVKGSRHAQDIIDQLALRKRTVVGASFTDLKMTDTLGVSVALSDYVGKGKYVLMDVWAAWCGPCRVANPKLLTLYNKYKSKNFNIVGVSLDRERTAWNKAIREDKLPWPQMSDLQFWQSDVVKVYNLNAIPYAILFDPQGKILYNPITLEQLDGVLKDLLDKPKK